MRTIIYTNHSENNYAISDLSAPNHYLYAARHKYSIMWCNAEYKELLKVFLLDVLSLLERFDVVVMLDSDALITNPEIKFEDLSKLGKDVIMCEEYLGPHSKINAGVVIVNNTQASKDMFRQIIDAYDQWISMPHLWQTWMNERLDSLPITLVEGRTFNSIVYGNRTYWHPGDFIAHFAGNDNREQNMRYFISLYGISPSGSTMPAEV